MKRMTFFGAAAAAAPTSALSERTLPPTTLIAHPTRMAQPSPPRPLGERGRIPRRRRNRTLNRDGNALQLSGGRLEPAREVGHGEHEHDVRREHREPFGP